MPNKMPVLPAGMKESKIPEQTDYANIPNRLTIVERVYYQEIGEPIYDIESRYSLQLKTKNLQVYEQRLRASELWKPLNANWLDLDGNRITTCSMLILRNEEGHFKHKIPSEQEKQEAAKLVIELAAGLDSGPLWLVAPQTTFRGCPEHLDGWYIRCPEGPAKFTLILIPA